MLAPYNWLFMLMLSSSSSFLADFETSPHVKDSGLALPLNKLITKKFKEYIAYVQKSFSL